MWEVSIGLTLNVSPQAVFILVFKHCLSMFWNFDRMLGQRTPGTCLCLSLALGLQSHYQAWLTRLWGPNLGLQAFIEQSLLTEVCFQLFLFMVILSALLQLEFSHALKHQVYFFINKALTIFFFLQSTSLAYKF